MTQAKTTKNKSKWRWLTWPPAVTFSVVFVIFLLIALFRLDPDFGWHLKSGEYFLAHGIPATDIFSYTASDFPWINHEWLSDILTYVLYSIGGYTLLCVISSAVWTFAVWLVARKVHNLTIILAVLAMTAFSGVRAITWSVLGLALLIVIMKAKNHRYRWFIPLLFLVWANVHGSFIIGFAYLLYLAIKERSLEYVIWTAAGAIMTLFNPYGLDIYVEVIRTITDSSTHARIVEWRSFWIPWIVAPYALLWACAFALTGYKNWKKYLGLDVIFFLAGMSSVRNLALFVIMSIQVTDERLRQTAAMIPKDLDKPRRLFVATVGVVITVAVLTIAVYVYKSVSLDREYTYPKNSVAYLQEHPCKGAIFNFYDYGGYLIWKLPSEKVYIDGRMATWVMDGQKYMDDYQAALRDKSARDKEFKKYNVQCVLMINNDERKELIDDLKKQHWTVAAEDPRSLLLVHQ